MYETHQDEWSFTNLSPTLAACDLSPIHLPSCGAVPYATQESRLVRYTSYCSRGTICASTGLNGAPQVRTKKERTNRSLPRQSRLETASTWALRTSNPLAVSRETATLALTMARSEDAAGESPEEGIGREDDAKAPRTTSTAAWISLAMLLLVYISNQWSRSLVYCELLRSLDTAMCPLNCGRVPVWRDVCDYSTRCFSMRTTKLMSVFPVTVGEDSRGSIRFVELEPIKIGYSGLFYCHLISSGSNTEFFYVYNHCIQ